MSEQKYSIHKLHGTWWDLLRLVVGTVGSEMPYSYYVGKNLTGRDIELAQRFAAWLGAEVEFKIYDYEGIIAAAQGGDVDCIMANLYITPERAESIPFSQPYMIAEIGVMVRDTGAQAEETEEAKASKEEASSFWAGIVSSFNKTFIRENRWELFVDGVLTTLLITVLSILLGTALGFLVFMLCRNGNIVANGVTRFSMWMVRGLYRRAGPDQDGRHCAQPHLRGVLPPYRGDGDLLRPGRAVRLPGQQDTDWHEPQKAQAGKYLERGENAWLRSSV